MTIKVRNALKFAMDHSKVKLFFSILSVWNNSSAATKRRLLLTFKGTDKDVSGVIKAHWKEEKIRAMVKLYTTGVGKGDSIAISGTSWDLIPLPKDFDLRNPTTTAWMNKHVTTNFKGGLSIPESNMDKSSQDTIIDWYLNMKY